MSNLKASTPLVAAENYLDIDLGQIEELITQAHARDVGDPAVNARFKRAMFDLFLNTTQMIASAKIIGAMLMEDD